MIEELGNDVKTKTESTVNGWMGNSGLLTGPVQFVSRREPTREKRQRMKQKYQKVKPTFPQIWKYRKGDYHYWMVSGRSKRWGLNIRKSFNSEKQSRDYVRELEKQLVEKRSGVSENLVYTDPQVSTLIDRLKPWGKSLEESVGFYIKHLESEFKLSLVPPIRELCETWCSKKTTSTLKPLRRRSVVELKSYSRFIQHKFGNHKPSEVTKDDIESVLSESYGNNTTKKTRLKFIRSFFKWCVEKRYVTVNPTDGIEVRILKKEVEIWSPEQISKLLTLVEEKYPSLLGFYVLCVFGGLRPTESERVRWEDINFEGKEIYVRPEGKTGSRRFVLEKTSNNETDVLWVWLNHFRKIQPKGEFNPFKKHHGLQREVRREMGTWSQDVLRHSFGTYYHNLIRDIRRVVYVMGNSEEICKRHYVREVKKSWTDDFWGLKPKGDAQDLDGISTEQNGENLPLEPPSSVEQKEG
jgi:integrase